MLNDQEIIKKYQNEILKLLENTNEKNEILNYYKNNTIKIEKKNKD